MNKLNMLNAQGYSDLSLNVISGFQKEYAEILVNSSFSPQTMNKLIEAYVNNKINSDDLFAATEYSQFANANEPYIDDFLNSIDNGVFHETAAKIFAAVNYEHCSYAEALELIKSKAFSPTNFASLSVTGETAKELENLGVPLRGCRGLNNCYDISDVSDALKKGDAIFVSDKQLAVVVNSLRKMSDWEQFKGGLKHIIGDTNKLTGDKLSDLYDGYVREKMSLVLYDKVKTEYDSFISEMKSASSDVIIQSAYEIVTKDNMVMYCQEHTPKLSAKEYAALMSSSNTLDEIYEDWCQNGELHSPDDIEIAIKETADKISVARERTEKTNLDEPTKAEKKKVHKSSLCR